MKLSTVEHVTSAKLLVKKSSFYAYIYPIESEDEVKGILEDLRKKHKQANHIAYAYRTTVINDDNEAENQSRANEDGEPSKTAGFPLLQLILQKDLTNILFIVAREFGGIKLGPSGLMRAYSHSAELALKENKIINDEITKEIEFTIPLVRFAYFESFLKQHMLEFKTRFDEDMVHIQVFFPLEKIELKENILRIIN